jgi:Methyltransferase domain
VEASSSSTSLYHAEFFNRHRDGSRRSAEIAVPLLIDLFEPRSVLDVGCATGVWFSVFREHGIDDILGFDGPWVERRGCSPTLTTGGAWSSGSAWNAHHGQSRLRSLNWGVRPQVQPEKHCRSTFNGLPSTAAYLRTDGTAGQCQS